MHARVRPKAQGKFIDVGDSRLWVRGVTYGSFRPSYDGTHFPEEDVVRRDFAAMAAAGFNAVRTYVAPPARLLDAAADAGLGVMVGLSWPAFDERFRKASDDVDVCWRLLEQGMTIGYSPAAVVWYHRRTSVKAYFRQQRGYGEAEALLERKWPEKYNVLGHVAWAGRLYGGGIAAALARRSRIYHGTWGIAPFQSVYRQTTRGLAAFALTPEWYLLVAVLLAVALLGFLWTPFALALPIAAAAAALSVARAVRSGLAATFYGIPSSRHRRLRLLTAWLHLLQPLARLRGRLDHGLTRWRYTWRADLAWPAPRTWPVWTMRRCEPYEWVAAIRDGLRRTGIAVAAAGAWDTWDLQVRGRGLGGVRLALVYELMRLRAWPRAKLAAWLLGGCVAGELLAIATGAVVAGFVFAVGAALVLLRALIDCGAASAVVRDLIVRVGWAEPQAARQLAKTNGADDESRPEAAERAA